MLGRIEKACDSALAALAAGDGKALEVLYDRMGRAILSVAYAVTGNLHDAEDVLSDTLVDAAVGAKGYRCGTGACAWLLTAARHNALDVVRRRSVRLRREAAEEEGAAEEPGFAAVETLDRSKRRCWPKRSCFWARSPARPTPTRARRTWPSR